MNIIKKIVLLLSLIIQFRFHTKIPKDPYQGRGTSQYLTPNNEHPRTNTQHPTPNNEHPTTNTQHPTTNTQQLTQNYYDIN